MKLIKQGKVYAPEFLGNKDILLAGDRIIKIADSIPVPDQDFFPIQVIEAGGFNVVPGFIDGHVHIIGGGGEGGFKTRTPEIQLTDLTTAGITTVVGVLGTDGTTRHVTSLLAKARGLEEEGLTTYIYTGSYQFPLQTITSNCRDDIILIDKVIGVGEIALADSRSSQPTLEEFKKAAALARDGGLLSGKAGIVHVHMGDGDMGLTYLKEICQKTEIPVTQFLPTHINRNQRLLDSSLDYINEGGMVDLTTSSSKDDPSGVNLTAGKAAGQLLARGVGVEYITFTSDGMGSLPQFNEKGEFIGLGIGSVSSLSHEMRKAVQEEGIALNNALKFITSNIAGILKLSGKGKIKEGFSADLVFLNDNLEIDTVIARGRIMVKGGEAVVKGTFADC